MEDRFRKSQDELDDAQVNAIFRIKSMAENIEALARDTVKTLPPRQQGERERLVSIGVTELEKSVSMLEKALS